MKGIIAGVTLTAVIVLSGLVTLVFALLFVGCNRNPGKNPEEKIEYVVSKAYENGYFVGSILVANQGKVIYRNNFGMSDAENKVSITDSTKFLIASLSKPITAILILRLKDQGKINLYDEIGKYFNVTNNVVSKVTIHQLLTHTSGIEELISENHELEEADLTNAKFNFEPGSAFRYCNTEYVILKEIAERASGKSFKELIEQEICGPAQMKSTGVASDLDLVNNLAIGYGTTDQITPVEIGYSLKIVDGAGSIYSSVSDLFKLDRALYSNELLSKETIELMEKQHVKEKFGYGWYLRERGGTWDVMYHEGDLPGFTSFFSRRTEKNETVILLSNSGGVDLSDLENDIARILKFDN